MDCRAGKKSKLKKPSAKAGKFALRLLCGDKSGSASQSCHVCI